MTAETTVACESLLDVIGELKAIEAVLSETIAAMIEQRDAMRETIRNLEDR